MKPLLTQIIVLSRTDYGEADRIVTVLTPDHGKQTLMARGVRKPKSKLAGGIELFSVSDVTYIKGKGEIGTLISTRLIRHYGNIVRDITRVQLGYELIKTLNRATEDEYEEDYFGLLDEALKSLDNFDISADLIRLWFQAQLLRYSGHTPNLQTTPDGHKLSADQKYIFDFDHMAFTPDTTGQYTADHIKFLRLIFSGNNPLILNKVEGLNDLLGRVHALVETMIRTHIRI